MPGLLAILLVADLLQPIDDLPIELFLNGNMRHCRGRRRAMPVLFAGEKPHYIARPNFLDWATLACTQPKSEVTINV